MRKDINYHQRGKPIFLLILLFLLAFLTSRADDKLDSIFKAADQSLENNNYAIAINQYKAGLVEAKKHRDNERVGYAYNCLGIAYEQRGFYEEALPNYFKAIAAYEQAGLEKKLAGVLKNIGNTYRLIRSYEKCYNFLKLSEAKFRSIKDSVGWVHVLNDIGLMYMDVDSNAKAVYYFQKVSKEFQKFAPLQVRSYALNNLGLSYSKLSKFDLAKLNYDASLKLVDSVGDAYGIALVLTNEGDLFNKMQRFRDAVTYSKRGLAISEDIGSNSLIASAYYNLAEAYAGLGKYQQSNIYLNRLIDIRDTIFKEESARSYAEMESRFQNERKQKEILLLKKDNTLKTLGLANQQKAKYLLITVLVFITIFATLLYRNYILKRDLSRKLSVVNQQLNEANDSKTKLLGIISHDLRSPVSSLFNYLQLQKLAPNRLTEAEQEVQKEKIAQAAENVLESMEDVLIWSKTQMEAFSLVHEVVDIDAFLEEIVSLNSTAAQNKEIAISKMCSPGLTLQTDLNFLRIILRNLVSNAVKFTPRGGAIALAAFEQNGKVCLSVKDSGPGIPDALLNTIFEWNSIRSDTSGLGLRLVKEFTEKLGGIIQVQSAASSGTTFLLSFANTY